MKLIAQVKLLPTPEQANALRKTLEVSNTACNHISNQAWEYRTFRQFPLHKLTYRKVREMFQLSAQVVVRCISKVADAYKIDRKTKRTFKPHGAIAFDNRILSYILEQKEISIWTVDGRQRIPFTCGKRQTELLKKRSKKEQRFARQENHRISKELVQRAKDTRRGIALEDLQGIRERVTVRRSQRRKHHSWSFYDLRQKIVYKAERAGIPVLFVNPKNTSRTCPSCGCIDKTNRKSQSLFSCVKCEFSGFADAIAAENIRGFAVNQAHVSNRSGSGTRPRPLAAG